MKHFILYIIFQCLILSLFSQKLTGNVLGINGNGKYDPLPNATLYWLGTDTGTLSDSAGHFELSFVPNLDKLIVNFTGYVDDTLTVRADLRFLNIVKRKAIESDSVFIKSRQKSSTFSTLAPQQTETLGAANFYKAACCNLGESFQTTGAVDVTFNDAVSGAKQIRLLGLSGIYSQIITENAPLLRGLATGYGLSYIPGPWMEKIDIAKGASSVLNGYEGLTGQINVEYKKPETSPKLHVNFYANQMSRLESSVNYATPVNKAKTLHTMFMLHGNYTGMRQDRNGDNFLDENLQKQYAFHNRWTYFSKKGMEFQLSVKQLGEERNAGTFADKNIDPVPNSNYHIKIATNRTEILSKIGYVNQKKPFRSIGSVWTGVFHQQNSSFGQNQYSGKENAFTGKIVYQDKIQTTDHTIRTGISYTFDDFVEKYQDSTYLLRESVPGIFGEYTYNYVEKVSLVAGLRADYHNIYGAIFTPRVHFRYLPTEKTTIRLSAGNGTRVPHIFADYAGFQASGREFSIVSTSLNNPTPLMPEKAWNYGASVQHLFEIGEVEGRIVADFYRTDFQNQVLYDREDAHKVVFYNLQGKSFSNAFQIETEIEPIEGLTTKIAYKWNQVRANYESGLKDVPFVPRNRGLLNIAYATENDKWLFDFTTHFTGKSRIPSLEGNSAAANWTTTSPAFVQLFGQITYKFKKWDIYLGGENLTNYRQANPIISAQNPNNQDFDATMVWGPVFGRNIYAGMRWDLGSR